MAAALPLLGQGPEVRRQLTGMGRRSRDEWTDFVRDAHDFSDIRRQQMVNAIYDTRVQAAENALTKELGRTQLIRPADRAALRYRVGPDSPMGQKIRRRAEQQTDRIIATDRKFREDWAAKAKRRKYPLQNRYQINRELEQRLEARSPWKSEQITDTEYQQAGSEAISDFYGETEIADPEADAFWYFVGPSAHDPRTCPICRSVLAGQPYTREGLVAALASAGAMAPEVFTAHPHERHQAQFKPPAGWVRRGDNTDAARGWATMNGDLEDVRTGELIPIDPPRTTPKFIRPRFPEIANNAYYRRVCGFGKACEGHAWALLKWSLRGGALETVLCGALDDQQLGAYGEKVVAQLFGASATPKQAALDAVIGKRTGLEIQTKRAGGREARVSMSAKAQDAKSRYAAEHGLEPHTVAVLVDDAAGQYRILHKEGFGNYRLSAMDELATVDMKTGAVVKRVDDLPWERAAIAEPPGLPRIALSADDVLERGQGLVAQEAGFAETAPAVRTYASEKQMAAALGRKEAPYASYNAVTNEFHIVERVAFSGTDDRYVTSVLHENLHASVADAAIRQASVMTSVEEGINELRTYMLMAKRTTVPIDGIFRSGYYGEVSGISDVLRTVTGGNAAAARARFDGMIRAAETGGRKAFDSAISQLADDYIAVVGEVAEDLRIRMIRGDMHQWGIHAKRHLLSRRLAGEEWLSGDDALLALVKGAE